jgi:2-oxoisovalerate dehydrogenase E2 component (dihydrolipoyl transacylase)
MKIELPQVGESVTEAIVGRWLKQVGDRVEKYAPLVEIVTDKVNMEFPSPESGVLSSILVEEGQTVPMGAVIAEMDVEGEPEREDKDDAVEAETVDRTGTLLKDVAPVGPTGSGGPMTVSPASQATKRYSPAVLRLAAEHDLDLSLVAGTGIGGRITRKDVQGYLDARTTTPKTAPGATADEERVPLTPVRRMIAANMVKSVTEIPEAWTVVEADVSGLVELREGAKARFQRREGVNLTYLPFVVKAVAEALKESRIVNSTWGGDTIILKRRVNVGVAIATPDGLVVPVVRDADSFGVAELAGTIDDLATRARKGKLKVADMQYGTFTINNTGALGSVTGKAIINYPQAAILNTEAIVRRPVVVGDAISIRSIMNLCLTFDHRIMDGADAGAFVSGVKRRLEAIGLEASGI